MYQESSQIFKNETAQVLTSAADILVFTPCVPIEIVSFGFVTTVTVATTTSTLALSLDLRPTAASDTGRNIGGGSLGTLTLTKAQANLLVAGTVGMSRVYDAAAVAASGAATPAAQLVLPGQQAVLRVVTQASSTGTGVPFIEFKYLSQQDRSAPTMTIVSA